VNSCFWPLYEVVDGEYRLTYEPDEYVPIEEWLRPQKRFAHLLRPESAELVERIQRQVAADWRSLRDRCEGGVPA
jgi:pyruvate ferredoxin oxidoreductase beta subunit